MEYCQLPFSKAQQKTLSNCNSRSFTIANKASVCSNKYRVHNKFLIVITVTNTCSFLLCNLMFLCINMSTQSESTCTFQLFCWLVLLFCFAHVYQRQLMKECRGCSSAAYTSLAHSKAAPNLKLLRFTGCNVNTLRRPDCFCCAVFLRPNTCQAGVLSLFNCNKVAHIIFLPIVSIDSFQFLSVPNLSISFQACTIFNWRLQKSTTSTNCLQMVLHLKNWAYIRLVVWFIEFHPFCAKPPTCLSLNFSPHCLGQLDSSCTAAMNLFTISVNTCMYNLLHNAWFPI